MLRKLAFLVSLISLCVPALVMAANDKLTPEEKAVLKCSPGVVLVTVSYKVTLTNDEGRVLLDRPVTLMGTGFLYRPDGYIVTNSHVIEDANVKDEQARQDRAARIFKLIFDQVQAAVGHPLSGAEKRYLVDRIQASPPVIRVYLANDKFFRGEIKAYSDPTGTNVGKDVAIVKIDANNLPTVKLGDSGSVRAGEGLMVIGYPGAASALGGFEMISVESALVPSVTSGHISAVKLDYKGTNVIQSDAAITHGNSGGPAFADGEVVGIATYGNDREVAGFNFFVPINTAMEFVRQAGASPETGAFDTAWSNALDAYEAGKWETAKGYISDALNFMPGLPDALRLQSVAAQKARSEGPVDRIVENIGGMLWPVVGLVALLLVCVIGIIVLRSGKKNAPAMMPAPVMAAAGASSGHSMNMGATQRAHTAPPPKPSTNHFGTMHVTSGALSGNRFPIPKAGLKIGRDSTKNDVVIADDTVSKEHAWIVPLENEVVVIDRGSSNGTFVNSVDTPSVNKVSLRNGDRVFIGKKGAAVLTYFSS